MDQYRQLQEFGGRVQSKNSSVIIARVVEVIEQYRSMILDPVEFEFGDNPRWPYLRSRLLKALGERGLEGRVREILSSFDAEKGASE